MSGELIQKHCPVERVALDGLEAGVADDSSEFFFRGAIAGAGGSDYVFFEHHRAYVVSAEVKAYLQDFQALRHPTGLHVFDVVEIEAGDGQHFQVLDRGRFFPAVTAEGCVFGLETSGDEGGEPAGLFLQTADNFKMIDALVVGFTNAEHHGGGGAHAELMRGAMDADPVFSVAFNTSNAMADVVVENFRTSAGDGIEAGIAQTDDGVAQAEVAVFGDGQDFGG